MVLVMIIPMILTSIKIDYIKIFYQENLDKDDYYTVKYTKAQLVNDQGNEVVIDEQIQSLPITAKYGSNELEKDENGKYKDIDKFEITSFIDLTTRSTTDFELMQDDFVFDENTGVITEKNTIYDPYTCRVVVVGTYKKKKVSITLRLTGVTTKYQLNYLFNETIDNNNSYVAVNERAVNQKSFSNFGDRKFQTGNAYPFIDNAAIWNTLPNETESNNYFCEIIASPDTDSSLWVHRPIFPLNSKTMPDGSNNPNPSAIYDYDLPTFEQYNGSEQDATASYKWRKNKGNIVQKKAKKTNTTASTEETGYYPRSYNAKFLVKTNFLNHDVYTWINLKVFTFELSYSALTNNEFDFTSATDNSPSVNLDFSLDGVDNQWDPSLGNDIGGAIKYSINSVDSNEGGWEKKDFDINDSTGEVSLSPTGQAKYSTMPDNYYLKVRLNATYNNNGSDDNIYQKTFDTANNSVWWHNIVLQVKRS